MLLQKKNCTHKYTQTTYNPLPIVVASRSSKIGKRVHFSLSPYQSKTKQYINPNIYSTNGR